MYIEQVKVVRKNRAATTEAERIVIEADPDAPVGSVVLEGARKRCSQGYAILIQQSKFITIRGLTITGAGGQAISLLGGNNQNTAIHLERNRIVGNGGLECDGGITVSRGNPELLISHNLIYGNGRNGLTFIDATGGPHYVFNNTIIGNRWNGVRVTRAHAVTFLFNNLIARNGVGTGVTGGRFGVVRENTTKPDPVGLMLLNNLVCGNKSGELNGPALDATDLHNLTPTGQEGSGVHASPTCGQPDVLFADILGADDKADTLDDDFTLASTSPAVDAGTDPRSPPLTFPLPNELLEADYQQEQARPRDGDGNGTAEFDIGAYESAGRQCVPKTTEACYDGPPETKDVGVCHAGTRTCQEDGTWGQCDGQVLPALEVCNGLDEDCDRASDEDLGQTTCGIGACQVTVDNCANGHPQTCTPGEPTLEICGNEIDEDCTGADLPCPPNHAPRAVDDAYETLAGREFVVAKPGVLVNDSDEDHDPLTAKLHTNPTHGTLTLNADGSFTYTPAVGFSGEDAFTYKANDGTEDSTDVATVKLTVKKDNHAPIVQDDTYTARRGQPLTVPAPGVLSNDRDSDDDTLTVTAVQQPSQGTVDLHPDGSFTYTPQLSTPATKLTPVLKWSWTSSTVQPNALNVMTVPAVIDLNSDGVPDVVFGSTASTTGSYVDVGVLRALRGDTGQELFTVTDPALAINSSATVAAGDIDGDGKPELMVGDSSGLRLIAFEHDGTFKWRSPNLEPVNWGAPAIADLDGDGGPEIIIGRQVLNHDGTLRWTGTGGRATIANDQRLGSLSLVVDVDLDGHPEVVAGNTVYRADGSILWQAPVSDGLNAAGNFDDDPFPEIVLVSNGTVQLFQHDGTLKWGPVPLPGGGQGGPPTIADFDGDGHPEIGVAGATRYAVFETDGSLKWAAVTQDGSSNVTGSSVFDFEGDGSAEVVYRDELKLRVYRGTDGAVLFETPMSSCTWYEYMPIVDVDGDGRADIVATANNNCGFGPQRGIFVFSDKDNHWVPTRKIWNQHTYHITNINEDGIIPKVEDNNWLIPGLNNFRLNTFSPRDEAIADTFTYTASDGKLDSPPATVKITIQPNHAPHITSTPITETTAGQPYTYDVDATDQDDDPLTYALMTAPAGMTIDPVSGVISWNPTNTDAGDHPVKVTVSDGHGGSDMQSFTLKVIVSQPSNHPPDIVSEPVLTATVGKPYTYDVDATDPDVGDILTYSLPVAPNGMTINPSTGVIEWTPTAVQTPMQNVEVKVEDGHNGSDTQSFAVIVAAPSINHAPTLVLPDPVPSCTVGQPCQIDIDATDPDAGDILSFSLAEKPDGMTIDAATGMIEWTPTAAQAGNNPVTVKVDDGHGGIDTQSLTVLVSQPGQTCTPPPSGMVSWWPGDGNANDISDGNNPSATNALNFVGGQVANGFTFGAGGFIEIPHSANLANQQFTLDAWVRPDGPGPNDDEFGNVILQKGKSLPQGRTHVSIGLWWSAQDYRFSFALGDTYSSTERLLSIHPFPPGQFYHVVGIYDGTTFRLFVDGVPEGQRALVKTIVYDSLIPWTIGSTANIYREDEGYPRTWNGVIDEVTLYNRALTAQEIQAIYNAGSAGKCKTPPDPHAPLITSTPTTARWEQLAPTGTPPVPRYAGSLHSYDEVNDRLIVFGGQDANNRQLNEVWVLGRASGLGGTPTWTKLEPTGTAPSPRALFVSAYDPTANRLIVYGGCSGICSPLADAWVLTHANGLGGQPEWLSLPASNPLAYGVGGYDPVSNRLVVFGGSTGVMGSDTTDVKVLLDANGIGEPRWVTLNPDGNRPPVRGHSQPGVYDPLSNTLIVFGGQSTAGSIFNFNDVWVLSHANGLGGVPTWTQLNPAGLAPIRRQHHTLAYDPNSNRLIMFGGVDGARNIRLNDTWILTHANGQGGTPEWIKLTSDATPAVASGSTAGYARASNRLIVALGISTAETVLNDVWVLTNANGQCTAGQPCTYDVDATDPDAGDTLTFSLDTAPTGMTIDPATGLINWIPTPAQIGEHNIQVRVTDPSGLFATQSFTLTVAPVAVPNVVGLDPASAEALIGAADLTIGTETHTGGEIKLNFDTLPSAQGWTYTLLGNSAPETSIFAVQGGLLEQNTMGTGFAGQGENTYRRIGVVDRRLPYTLMLRAHVLDEEGAVLSNPFGFGFVVHTGIRSVNIGVGKTLIDAGGPNDTLVSNIDNSQFHNFALVFDAKTGHHLLVDGVSVAKVNDYSENRFGATLFLGDHTGGTNARAEVAAYSFTQPHVASQNPPAGTLVPNKSSVDLTIQDGPATATVPNVVGLTRTAAEAAIVAASLKVGTVTTANSDTVPAGKVISQTPVASTHVVPQTTVDLVISLGPIHVNHPPTITSTAILTTTKEHLYSYDVEATDPDTGDALIFSLSLKPDGMTIDQTTGVVQWTPTAGQVGDHSVSVRVTDSGALFAEQSFTVTVKVTNTAPVADAGLLGAPGLPACVAPPGGLVSWYPGDGNSTDIIGPNSPTSVGNPQFVAGKVGQGIRFDGNSGLIVPNSSTINFGKADSFSIDAWVRVEGVTGVGDNLIVDKKTNLPLNRGYSLSALLLSFSPIGTTRFNITIQEDHSRIIYGQVTTRPVPLGEFHHVVGVVDRTKQTIAIYLNGVLEQELSIANVGDIAGGAQLSIGRHNVSPQSPLVGTVDELEIFNRALSQAEIQSLFLAGSAGKCKIRPGETVHLDGSQSTDPDSDQLSYHWTLLAKPDGSTATLSDVNAAQPTFVVDKPGTYRVQLVVNDGTVDSAPSAIAIGVLDANRPSLALDDMYTTTLGETLNVSAPGVIANDHDADGDPLAATKLTDPAHGTLSFNSNGSFAYTPDAGVDGPGSTAHTVIATIYPNGAPKAFALNPTTNRLYVSDIFGNTVSVIDGATNKIIAVVPSPHSYVEDVAVNPVTNRIYVSGTQLWNYGSSSTQSNEVTVINGATNTVLAEIAVGHQPQDVAVNQNTNRIYVANVDDHTVSVINGATNTVIATVPVGAKPRQIGVNSDTNRVYVLSADDATVSVIDGATNAVLSTISVGSDPRALVVDRVLNRLYTANFASDSVSVIDGTSDTVMTTIPVGDSPQALALNDVTGRLYVTNFTGNTVSVIDTATNLTVGAAIPVGVGPYAITINPLTNRISVANQTDNSLSVIDGMSATVTATVPVDANPWNVTVNLLTDQVYTANFDSHSISVVHVGDHFTYKVSDGQLDSNAADVTIVIEPGPLAPVAEPDAYTTSAGTTLTVAAPGVLGNDGDANGDALTVTPVTHPTHGTLTLNSNGSFTYTPAAGFAGTDTFTYKANDGALDSNTATVTINVTATGGGNHPPQLGPLTCSAAATVGQPYQCQITASDPDQGDVLTFSLTTKPEGMAINASTGLMQWTPTTGQVGGNPVTARVTDTGGLFVEQSFTITVAATGQTILVPNVLGKTQADATAMLVAANLQAGVIDFAYSDTAAAGLVIKQDPAPNSAVAPQSPVALTLSLGPNAVKVTVPNVIGQTQTAATTTLATAQLGPGFVVRTDTTRELTFTTLPQQHDGWFYLASGNAAPETQVFSVTNGVLQQNTLGVTPDGLNVYELINVVRPHLPFALTVTARVLQEQGDPTDPFGFGFGVVFDTEQFAIGLRTTGVHDPAGTTLSTTIDTTQFHDYRIEGAQGQGFRLFVDGVLVGTGKVSPRSAPAFFVFFGDASDTANARGEIKSVSFEQGAGLVIDQHPVANVQASTGSLVDLLIAKEAALTTVPNVVDTPKASAITAIVAAKLLVGAMSEAFSNTVPQGSVISQIPAANAHVPQRTAVDLKISRGPPTATVPDVRGKPQADAVAMLVAARLTAGAVTTAPSATVPAGRVLSQNPNAGAIVPADSAVALVISTGASNLISVPNVTGKPQAEAEALLLAAKLVVGDVTTDVSNAVPIGQVISQNPTAGTVVSAGVAVRLVVSEEQRPPLVSILVQPASPLIVATQTQTFHAIGILQDGTSRNLTSRVTWASSAATIASIDNDGVATGVAEGVTAISASLDGVTGSTSLTVRAAAADDHALPTAVISAPSDDATLTDLTDVKGTATDPNFLKYVLDYAPVGQSTFTTLTTGTTPVTDGVLGRFDPTLLINDLYTLRLTVYDRGGNATETSVQVQVSREQKVGNFTLAFQDVSIPMACLPLTVTRTYDSRDKQQGDFGVGWRLDVNTLRLRESSREEDGKSWHVDLITKSGPFGFPIPTYVLVEDDTHKVSITLPDGKVEEFDLDPFPRTSQFQELVTATARYTPRPGTLGSLAVPEEQRDLVVSDGELLKNDFSTVYDPRTFLYTTPEGAIFTIDKFTGVQGVQCTNGQTLTFGPLGILHSAGKSVVFERDAQGRITKIIDPNGKMRQYAYNANGDLVSYLDPENNLTKFTYNFRHGMLDIVDPRGVRAIRNEYDADGRLISSTDADGKPIIYTHDLATRTETVTDRLGHETVFKYDDKGNVLEQIDALGNSTKFKYDAFGNEEERTDPLNRTTTRTFDTKRNVLSEKDPLGHETKYTYSALNAVRTITDPLLRTTTNTYDSKGNLTETIDPLNNHTTYTYDNGGVIIQGAGNLLSTTDALNHTTHYEYDAFGNVKKETDPTGHMTTYTYDANGNRITQTTTRTTETGIETLTTTFTYDALNRLTKTTYPDNSTTQTIYNAIGKQAKTIDQLGRTTSYEYDNQGRLKSTTYPDGTSESSTYDDEGRRKTSTDRGGRVTSYDYDDLGRLVKTTHPDGAMETTKYDAAGQVEQTTDARGNVTKYTYDKAGRRETVTDALNHVTTFKYDDVGNQTDVIDALNHTTTHKYDDNNRRTKVIYPDGTFEETKYDALGRTEKKTDQAGKMTQFEYDELGRLKKVTDALGQETTYTYDEMGNQLTQTDANLHTTTFTYDQLGRRVRRTLPLGQFETMVYNAVGNLTSKTDFNGKTTTYAYDSVNRLITKTPDPSLNEPAVTFTYTPTGQRESMSDASGTTSYTYDIRDRLTEKATRQGTLAYTYDDAGNLLTLNSSHANGVSVDYEYDKLNRLSKVTDNRLNPPGETTYAYDNVGNLDHYDYPNGVTHQYTYNNLNRLTDLTVGKVASPTLASYIYDLGPAGNRTAVTEKSGRKASYTYDDLYRLKEEKIENDPASINGTIGYDYDPVGNRKTRTSTVPGIANQTFTYDNNDRLTSDTYDANGNTVGSDSKTYDYDYENHLTNQNGNGVVIIYDGDGNRVSKVVGGVITQYLVDDRNHTGYAQVVEEIVNGTVDRLYTYGLDLISQNQSSGVSYYGYDGHGSVRFLTDTSGAVTDTYDYDAFGNLIHSTGSTPNNYLYTGEQLDPNVGFYYLRARYYKQQNGRFISLDRFLGGIFDPRSLHLYSYVFNNPANFGDPSGRFPNFILGLPDILTVTALQGWFRRVNAFQAWSAYKIAKAKLAAAGVVFEIYRAFFNPIITNTGIRWELDLTRIPNWGLSGKLRILCKFGGGSSTTTFPPVPLSLASEGVCDDVEIQARDEGSGHVAQFSYSLSTGLSAKFSEQLLPRPPGNLDLLVLYLDVQLDSPLKAIFRLRVKFKIPGFYEYNREWAFLTVPDDGSHIGAFNSH